ncbi:hypothetical protein [Herpetosiphon giganteus]|uniref:hypothetical protein n=1 Tax=Herpetosiphon giganteus TaxID=2029754 RepID=UPI00195922F1|nr:hypothetical protein [Herpetosiphon giganteus]MBM7845724.1 hypothetical protein [Herpetosiphon giganteus]
MLNRRERVGQTLRAARNAVATVVPAWIPADWIERYGPRVDTYHFPKAESTRTTVANQIGTDGALLLAQIDTAAEPWLTEIPAVKTLRAVCLGGSRYHEP